MNGAELREVIKRLGLSQVGLAAFLGYDDLSIRRWIADRHPVPVTVEMLLRVMIRKKLSPDFVAMLIEKPKRAA